MNYYIQGNKEKADQIRAAFEAKGYVMHTGIQCDLSDMIYYSLNGKVGSIKLRNLDLFKTHPNYQELELPVEPKFKVGDWVAGIDDEVKDFSMWHPASKHPIFSKDEDSVWVYCLVYRKGTDGSVLVPMSVEFTKLGWRLSENIIVKWWCYTPKGD